MVSLALAVSGAVTALMETQHFFASGVTIEEKLTSIRAGRANPGPSEVSRRAALNDCYLSIGSVAGRASSAAAWNLVLKQCQSLADSILGTSPINSYAWLVKAAAAAELRDLSGLNEYLQLSQQTAPNESWLARLRVTMGERWFPSLDRATQLGHSRDLAVALSSDQARPALVDWYVQDRDFRLRMREVVSMAPPELQRQFIQAVSRHSLLNAH